MSGILKSKRCHRFRVHFNRFGGTSGDCGLMQQVLTVTRPIIDEGALRHGYMFTIVMRDDVTNLASKLIRNQLRSQFATRQSIHDIPSTFDLFIDTLDDDVVLERWNCMNCKFTEVSYGNFDYADPEPLNITMLIHCEKVEQLFQGDTF